MRIIDLTLPIYTGMPVFPGDPEASVEVIQTIEKDGWEMRRLHINGHDGTHVNVPSHAVSGGKTLDGYTLDAFIGEAVLFTSKDDIQKGKGVIFSTRDITEEIAGIILERKPKFVGLASEFDFNLNAEKTLLEGGIISYERLANTEQLPERFTFYGVPLKILDGDGSPVRAFAVV
ncbi:MAG: cyclase family protein [bacterium]|nr:cyclase family protein [bacterium]